MRVVSLLLYIISSRLAKIILALIFISLLAILEKDLHSASFALLGIGVLFVALLAISRRVSFSVYLALIIALLLALASMVKAWMTGMSLHSFDLTLIADPQVLAFLTSAYATYAVPALCLAVTMALAVAVIYLRERPVSVKLWHAGTAAAVLGSLTALTVPRWANETSYLFQRRHLSALMVSFRDLPQLWAAHPLTARVARAGATEPYEAAFICRSLDQMPDIVLVHAESQLPPEWMDMPPIEELADSFRSQDDNVHHLRAETYGGGSWITIASVMTGLPAGGLGWMRQFLSSSVIGNVKASFPQILAECGYDTTAQLAMAYDQFALGPMLDSLGFDEINDSSVTGVNALTARDRDYLGAALKRLQEKRASSPRPQFLYVETMFAHSPYTEMLEPDEVLPAQPFSSDAVENEYLRRLVIARRDLDHFKNLLAGEPGPNGVIVVEFGDHRPMVQLRQGALDLSDFSSPAYGTYFAADGYGTAVDLAFPSYPLDAPYLGYWLLEASGIAEGGVVEDMRQLRELCSGRLHLCEEAGAVDEMLKRRVESGLLVLRPLMGSSISLAEANPRP